MEEAPSFAVTPTSTTNNRFVPLTVRGNVTLSEFEFIELALSKVMEQACAQRKAGQKKTRVPQPNKNFRLEPIKIGINFLSRRLGRRGFKPTRIRRMKAPVTPAISS